MDSDFPIDLPQVLEDIRTAEVLSILFPLVRKVLLLDTRHDSLEGPLVRVAPMVNSVEERTRSLRRMRPRFGAPEEVRLVPWPKYVASLERLGVVDALAQRIVLLGYADRVPALRRALQELQALEQDELLAAVTGDNYDSLWERYPRGAGPE
ncbi:MAG: hypothetical protein HY689_06070 [Chloroflexi bacterium]|nr:hypothetical protein [Chloroflexota bacterium]